jgi:hypothetical protein
MRIPKSQIARRGEVRPRGRRRRREEEWIRNPHADHKAGVFLCLFFTFSVAVEVSIFNYSVDI